jgi:arylsulfatase A-like enzyme/predicted Zn-dependent protease
MFRIRPWTWVLPAVLCLLFSWSCSQEPSSTEAVPPLPADLIPLSWEDVPEQRDWNFLLITLDTTRRDVLGAYGDGSGATPHLDSLALEGTVFEEVIAPIPITLPSHTTLMSGLDPYQHGVRHNAIFTVSDTLVTLAELFKERGYQTAAFVSGFPLDHSFGLDQGFNHYDDILSERAFAAQSETAERRADDVNRAALGWVDGQLRRPFFLWVHYFDPHYPYDPPQRFKDQFPSDPYRGEVAFMDEQVGHLLGELERLNALDKTLILLLGDHGESLGEHKESTHSFFVYDATQLVPCILVPPDEWRDAKGKRIPGQIRLRDLTPTIANILGWSPEPWRETGSVSVLSSISGSAPAVPVAYVESFVPALEYGWSDLRGVRTEQWKYIRAPKPELYRLSTDPGELENVLEDHPEVADQLGAWLDWYIEEESEEAFQAQELDPETLERLRSLGYLGGGVASGEETGADPKDRIEVHLNISLARQRGAEFQYEDAIRILRPVVRKHAELLEARRLLALYSYLSRDLETARALYEDLVERDPDNASYLAEMVPVLIGLDESERALDLLDQVEERDPDEEGIYLLRGQVLESMGRMREALDVYDQETKRNPEDAAPYWNKARILQHMGEREEAHGQLTTGFSVDSKHPPTLAALADISYGQGIPSRGDSLLAAALEWDPHEPQANYLKGYRARKAGNFEEARAAYERALRANPDFTKARANLVVLYLEMRQPEQARRTVERGLALGQDTADMRLNLGVALAQMGQVREAAEHWEKGLQLGPSPETARRLEQNLNQARRIISGETP